MKRALILIACAIVAGSARGADASADLDRQLAREPVAVTTVSGRTVRGLLDGVREGRLFVRLATDGGEVGYSFAPGEIAGIAWPGEDIASDAMEFVERGAIDEALPLLEALARHRLRYLPLLDEARQEPLWALVRHGAAVADPDRLLGVIRAMEPLATDAAKRSMLLEARLEIAVRTGATGQAGELARLWCREADPAGASALGWHVLARLAYDSGEYDAARWYALQPVTFSTSPDMRDLGACYAVAIAAAEHLGDATHAHTLADEMSARRIARPEGLALSAPDRADAAADGPALSPAPNPGAPPPRNLEGLRKIPHTPPAAG